MPHTRSAKRHLRKSEKQRRYNRTIKRTIKEQIKKFETVLAGSDVDAIKKEYNLTAKKLDKAAAHKVVHPNLASRKKSQLARQVHAKAAAPAGK